MAWGLAEQDAERRGYEQGILEGQTRGVIKGRNEGITIGLEKGAYQTKIETAKNMLQTDISIELISRFTGLSMDEVKEIKNTMN